VKRFFSLASLGLALFALGFTGVISPASLTEAQGGLSARVYLVQQRIPRGLNEQGLIRFARGHNARRLNETTSEEIRHRKWNADMIVAFNRPVGDSQFQVLFYDVQEGRRFVAPALDVFVNNRDEKTILQRIRLERPNFEPNRRMELVVVVRRREVGRTRFELVGENVRHSGRVDFTGDE